MTLINIKHEKNIDLEILTDQQLKELVKDSKKEMEKRKLDFLFLKELSMDQLITDQTRYSAEIIKRNHIMNNPAHIREELIQRIKAKESENKGEKSLITEERIDQFVNVYEKVYEYSDVIGGDSQEYYNQIFQFFKSIWIMEDILATNQPIKRLVDKDVNVRHRKSCSPESILKTFTDRINNGEFANHGVINHLDERKAKITIERIKYFISVYKPIYEYMNKVNAEIDKAYDESFRFFQTIWLMEDCLEPERKEHIMKDISKKAAEWNFIQSKITENKEENNDQSN